MEKRISYGGQAVIEGVMIRGRDHYSLAVRKPNGEIATQSSRLSTFYTGRLRNIPLIRGVIVLIETLVIGMKALSASANIALEEEGKELSGWSMGIMLTVSLGVGIGLFFIAPLLAIRSLDNLIASDAASNLVEGLLRLAMFLAYILLIGLMPDIRRVFAYHGAEHMTVHAHERNDPLEVEAVRRYPTAHNPLRHGLPPGGHGRSHRRLHLPGEAIPARQHSVAGRSRSYHRRHKLRGYPLQRRSRWERPGEGHSLPQPGAPEAHHSPAGRRADRGGHPRHEARHSR